MIYKKHIRLIELANDVADEFNTLLWSRPVKYSDLVRDLRGVTTSIGLYLWRNIKTKEPLYVGRSIQHHRGGLRKRMRQYVKMFENGDVDGSKVGLCSERHESEILFMDLGEEHDALLLTIILEAAIIHELCPKYNIQLKR